MMQKNQALRKTREKLAHYKGGAALIFRHSTISHIFFMLTKHFIVSSNKSLELEPFFYIHVHIFKKEYFFRNDVVNFNFISRCFLRSDSLLVDLDRRINLSDKDACTHITHSGAHKTQAQAEERHVAEVKRGLEQSVHPGIGIRSN